LEQRLVNKKFEIIADKEGLLPIKITAFYKKKIDEEVAALGGNLGPLHRVALPTAERLALAAPREVKDFVDDRSNSRGHLHKTFMIRKYAERMLYLPTSHCVGNCQYCFRTDVLTENTSGALDSFRDELVQLTSYLKQNPAVTELILSGGDPLTLPFGQLQEIFETVSCVPTVKNFRIHTRSIVYGPNAFTREKISLFKKHAVRIVFHIVHPYEVCEVVAEKINELREAGLRLYNQFPLLRNTNDHHHVIYRLVEKLELFGVRNLSVYIPDPITFSAAYRVRLSRVWKIIDDLNWSSPSWVNSMRFVFDSSYGKARREDFRYTDVTNDIAYFEREGQLIPYPDFPSQMDVPGKLDVLLWKGDLSPSCRINVNEQGSTIQENHGQEEEQIHRETDYWVPQAG
jgi:lysine 2,3-aminomutase